MNNVVVDSWEGLIHTLYENSYMDDINRYRSNYVFRGINDKKYVLETSLQRNCGNLYELEDSILRNFLKYARLESESKKSIWSILAVSQHHGLPTRLLDWTYSPFIAMHFATANMDEFDKDAVIWCVDMSKIHNYAPIDFQEKLKQEKAVAFSVETLSSLIKNLEEFDKIKDIPFIIFFEPPSIDDRIVNQYSVHSIVSSAVICIEEILTNFPETYKKIIIPKELKLEIRDKLDQANINERVLFPGLDGLCKWLARYYMPTAEEK